MGKIINPQNPKTLFKFLPVDLFLLNPISVSCVCLPVVVLQNQGIEEIKRKFEDNFVPVLSRLWVVSRLEKVMSKS